MIQGNFPPNHTPNQDLNLNNVDQTGCINTNRPITASLLDILAVGPVKSEVLTRNQMVRLDRTKGSGNALEEEIDAMKKWTADEIYDNIRSSSPLVLLSARTHVFESVKMKEDLLSIKNSQIKWPYDGDYLCERLVHEILSIENIVMNFENTEKEAQRLLDYMIGYPS